MLSALYLILGLVIFVALAGLTVALRQDIGGGHALSFSNRLGVVHGVSRLRHHRPGAILTEKNHVDCFHNAHSWNGRLAVMAPGQSHDMGDEPR